MLFPVFFSFSRPNCDGGPFKIPGESKEKVSIDYTYSVTFKVRMLNFAAKVELHFNVG